MICKHIIALWSLECTCWRQLGVQWGDCYKNQQKKTNKKTTWNMPFNVIIIGISMCIISHVHAASWLLSSYHTVGCCVQTFGPDSFIPAMLQTTVTPYHFILLSVALTLTDWMTRSVKCSTCWGHFLAHFSSDQNEICYDSEVIQVQHPCTSLLTSQMCHSAVYESV